MRHVPPAEVKVGFFCRAPDQPMVFLQAFRRCAVIARSFLSLFGPQEFLHGIIKGFETAVHRWVIVEESQAVVVQQGGCRPYRNQCRYAIKAWPAPSVRRPRWNLVPRREFVFY